MSNRRPFFYHPCYNTEGMSPCKHCGLSTGGFIVIGEDYIPLCRACTEALKR